MEPKFKPGDKVVWIYSTGRRTGRKSRPVFRQDAIVLGYGRGRVKVEIALASGKKANKFVKEESLHAK